MLNMAKRLFVEEDGQGMTEYALVLGVIALGVVGVIMLLGNTIKGLFENVTSRVQEATTTTP